MILDFPHTVAVNEYGFYCVPTLFAEKVVPTILSQGRVYEPRSLSLMRRWARTGDIVSGGAFIGDFLPALCDSMSEEATLWSFEPQPLAFKAAQFTVKLNRLKRVVINNYAVGDQPGKLPLRIYDRQANVPTAASASIVEGASGEDFIDVPVITLDELVTSKRNISILHLDIEGFELRALKGATRIITHNAPLIILEAPTPRRAHAYLDYLSHAFADLNYQLTGMMENNAYYLPANI